jgi:hypothetical protein
MKEERKKEKIKINEKLFFILFYLFYEKNHKVYVGIKKHSCP